MRIRACDECGQLKPNKARHLCARCYKRLHDKGLLDRYPTVYVDILALAKAKS